jgi:hypothetical protein
MKIAKIKCPHCDAEITIRLKEVSDEEFDKFDKHFDKVNKHFDKISDRFKTSWDKWFK